MMIRISMEVAQLLSDRRVVILMNFPRCNVLVIYFVYWVLSWWRIDPLKVLISGHEEMDNSYPGRICDGVSPIIHVFFGDGSVDSGLAGRMGKGNRKGSRAGMLRGRGKSGSLGWFALPAWEFPTFWEWADWWGYLALPWYGDFRRVGNKRRRARAWLLRKRPKIDLIPKGASMW